MAPKANATSPGGNTSRRAASYARHFSRSASSELVAAAKRPSEVDREYEKLVRRRAGRAHRPLRVPSGGPLTAVPVLMLNGDINLQSPLESAQRAQAQWPNSVFLTIADAPHVTVLTSECAVVTAVSFLANPVVPVAQPAALNR